MKNNPLDNIVKCDIDVSSPGSSDAVFDTILMLVPGPEKTGDKTMEKVTSISSADELMEYGFTVEDAAYIAAAVAFSQNPAPAELNICIRRKASSAGEETDRMDEEDTVEGKNAEVEEGADTGETGSGETGAVGYEDIAVTLSRADSEAGFYGIHLTSFKDPADVEAAASWTEAHEKIFGFEYDDLEHCPVKNFSYFRSFGMYSGNADGYENGRQPSGNQYAALAWMAKCFGYDPGSETWHLKELAAIVPSSLSADQNKQLEEKNINRFMRYAGCNCTIGGTMVSGEWIDVIRFRDWLKTDMQTRVFNILKGNRKVPFTDPGISLIEGAMEKSLKEGQDMGGIAPSEYDSDDNLVPGYQVSVPRASDLTEAQRKSRKLPGCKYSARLAGAIHAVNIQGFLTF